MQLKDLKKLLVGLRPEETLFIVSCTKSKVWMEQNDCGEYIPAKDAYTGENFRHFINWFYKNNIGNQGYKWVVLSGKYGFIEPNHPISYYDILLGDPSYHGISDESLRNQVLQKRWWNGSQITLNKFNNIIGVNCEKEYPKKLKIAFSGKNMHFISFEE